MEKREIPTKGVLKQTETMLQQGVTNRTEFKLPHFKRKKLTNCLAKMIIDI